MFVAAACAPAHYGINYRAGIVSRQRASVSSSEMPRGRSSVPKDYIVKPVEKAIQVLRCVSVAPSPMSLKEITSRVNLPKTTVFRYLHTLRACGLIAHDCEGDLYRVDSGILSLAPQTGGLQRLREIAVPFMQALRKRWNETVNLGVVEGANIVYVEIFESHRALRMQARVGRRDPVHTTAIGKAILAHLPEDLAHQILPPRLRKRTAYTISSAANLARELELARTVGYASEEGENEEGASCIGAPIFDERNKVAAGLSISAPAARLTASMRQRMAPSLIDAARRISTTLGFQTTR
jgi:IclR family transcriptional regulator, KDG regulon repressor